MGPQHVLREVAVGIAPHRVDVVGAALGVVVFHQQPRALDSVVVRLARLDVPRPGKGKIDEVVDVLQLRFHVGQRIGDPPDLDIEEGPEHLLLVGREG